MPKGQGCSCLEGLDGNAASDFTDNRQIQELADEEALVVLQIGHDHLQEVVGLTRNQMAGYHLGHCGDGLLELESALIGMAFDLHSEEDREPEADPVASQRCAIALN